MRRRPDHVARAGDLPDVQVHFEEFEPASRSREALEEVLGHFLGIRRGCGVGVEENLVAELAPQHLPDRHTPGLTREVPTGHLHCRDAAAPDPRLPVLLDLVKDRGDIAGVHSQDSAFQHQREGLARPRTHIAPPGNTLVRVEPDRHRRSFS